MRDRFLRSQEVRQKTGLSLSTIWRQERTGDFPKRRLIGRKAVGWLESEVETWLQARAISTATGFRSQGP